MWLLIVTIHYFFKVLTFLIIIRIILSWMNLHNKSTLVNIVYQLTEPILAPFRNLLFKFGVGGGYIDFSPLLAVFTLNILESIILKLL